MSKIREELVAATKFVATRGEDDKKSIIRLVLAVQDLPDPAWNALTDDARNWYQQAADAINLMDAAPDTALPAFPDAAPAPAVRARARVAAPTPAPAPEPDPTPDEGNEGELLVGDVVSGVTKRGKAFSGTIKEVTEDGFVLDDDTEFTYDKVESIEVAEPEQTAAEGGDDEIAVGDTVEIVTLRDKIIVGVVEELQEDLIVYKDSTGAVDDIAISRTKSVTLKHRPSEAAPAPAPASTRPPVRRGATPAPAPTPTTAPAPAPAARRTRGGPDGKPSVGTRIQQLIAANPAISMAEVTKTLQAEEIKAADATVDMQYKTLTGFVALLRESGKLK